MLACKSGAVEVEESVKVYENVDEEDGLIGKEDRVVDAVVGSIHIFGTRNGGYLTFWGDAAGWIDCCRYLERFSLAGLVLPA